MTTILLIAEYTTTVLLMSLAINALGLNLQARRNIMHFFDHASLDLP